MGRPDSSIKKRLKERLEQTRPGAITEEVWKGLLERLAPVSESYLRDLLRASGIPFDQPYAGVRQHTFEELEASLAELARVYLAAMAAGDRERARYCRRMVIAAKDRAKFAAASARGEAAAKERKREMAQWMLVWLEDPDVFAAWARARRRAMADGGQTGAPID